jgi:hypothetical protein
MLSRISIPTFDFYLYNLVQKLNLQGGGGGQEYYFLLPHQAVRDYDRLVCTYVQSGDSTLPRDRIFRILHLFAAILQGVVCVCARLCARASCAAPSQVNGHGRACACA